MLMKKRWTWFLSKCRDNWDMGKLAEETEEHVLTEEELRYANWALANRANLDAAPPPPAMRPGEYHCRPQWVPSREFRHLSGLSGSCCDLTFCERFANQKKIPAKIVSCNDFSGFERYDRFLRGFERFWTIRSFLAKFWAFFQRLNSFSRSFESFRMLRSFLVTILSGFERFDCFLAMISAMILVMVFLRWITELKPSGLSAIVLKNLSVLSGYWTRSRLVEPIQNNCLFYPFILFINYFC